MRWLRALGGGVAALILCLVVVKVTQTLGLVPRFPAYAGEDDFALRAGVFFLVTCPSLAILGGWIALASSARVVQRMIAGAAVATLLSFAVLAVCRGSIEQMASSRAANIAALSFLIGWPQLCALGAWWLRATARSG